MDFSFTTIIIIILLIIIVYFIWTMLSSSSTTVSSGGQDASKSTPMTVTASNSFTISTWVYINSWDSTANKTIVSTPPQTASTSTFSLTLGKADNNLYVNVGGQSIPVTGTASTVSIPLQTWVSIIATVNNGNSLDIYINGKLVQTTALKNVYSLLAGTINVGGGIDGAISSTFNSTPFGPQDAWNTYSSGYGSGGGSSISDFFNKYKVRFAFVKDNVELSRLDI